MPTLLRQALALETPRAPHDVRERSWQAFQAALDRLYPAKSG